MRLLVAVAVACTFLSSPAPAEPAAASVARPRAQVMVVGAYHFVSKANLFNMDVDDPMSPKRQAEIADVVAHLAAFHPTKIILEETSGTSHLEENYQAYRAGHFDLPPSENYQIGFRLAKSAALPRIFLTNARTDFDFDALVASAKAHGQMDLVQAAEGVYTNAIHTTDIIQKNGTILEMYRYLNSDEQIRLNNSGYMFTARVGANTDFAGAKLVAGWYLRSIEMYAQMTQIVSPDDRILILYGQGHAYMLRELIKASLDLTLVEASSYLH